jgi:hypothetical protein
MTVNIGNAPTSLSFSTAAPTPAPVTTAPPTVAPGTVYPLITMRSLVRQYEQQSYSDVTGLQQLTLGDDTLVQVALNVSFTLYPNTSSDSTLAATTYNALYLCSNGE